MNCGWICLVEYPFTDGSGAKVRPVLVVSQDRYNQGGDVVVVPISSRTEPDDPYSVYVDASSPIFRATGLRQSSGIKWNKPFTLSKRLLFSKLGILKPLLLAKVQAELVCLFSGSEPVVDDRV